MDLSTLRTTRAHVLIDPADFAADGVLLLDDATEHHLRRVVRLRDGEAVSVADGAGSWRLSVVRVAGTTMHLEPTSEVAHTPRREAPVTIATAMPKGDRLDWLVQKVSELGVDHLTLLHCDRSVVRWTTDKANTQRGRLQRIADEAFRQSRRVWRLEIDGPADAEHVLATCAAAEPDGPPLGVGDRSIAIGPEGGWSERELAVAASTVSLAATILRTETAAVTAAALCVAFDR